MSSFLQLLSRQGAIFLFVLLEIVCVYILITKSSHQQEVAKASWLQYSGEVKSRTTKVRNYIRLEEVNKQLQEENAKLLSLMPNAYYDDKPIVDSIHDDSLRQRYVYVPAEIINKSPLTGNITYVLNRGHIHGVEPHLGVISPSGVVGIVTEVSPRHSRVMSLMHHDMRVSAGLRNKSYFGSLRWDGGDVRYATLYSIPDYARIALGDTVETTGYSNVFPTGIALGEIVEEYPNKGSNTLILKVKLFNDFFEMKHAYIVRDLMKGDIAQLPEEE